MSTTRTEQIAWVKERALRELGPGGDGPNSALASAMSDLRKHPETDGHAAMELGMMLAMSGHLRDSDQMRQFIEGIQ